MHEITIISGKGGTGKTSITACFGHLAENTIMCDLDVDASDLHIILQPQIDDKKEFYSGDEYFIDYSKCDSCGLCYKLCKFGAISKQSKARYHIDAIACEDCGVCKYFCPQDAIITKSKKCGEWYNSKSRFGSFIHAKLTPGEENSGLLVTLLRKEAKILAEKEGAEFIIYDGSPGIGCPVISSLSGIDVAVIVTEPTPSGLHDLKRVSKLCEHFSVPSVVIINKCDLNQGIEDDICAYCNTNNIKVISKIPFDNVFIDAMIAGNSITEHSNSIVSDEILKTWKTIKRGLT